MRDLVLNEAYDFPERPHQPTTINRTADFANAYAYDGDQQLAMVQQ